MYFIYGKDSIKRLSHPITRYYTVIDSSRAPALVPDLADHKPCFDYTEIINVVTYKQFIAEKFPYLFQN